MNHHQLEHHEYQHEQKKYPLSILLHDIEIPTNVGSVFRIADALGVEKVYLSGNTPVPPNRKIKKTSRSAEQFVAYEYHSQPLELLEQLSKNGYEMVSLEITDQSQDIAQYTNSKDKICLILGAENMGVSPVLLEQSDAIVHIPMLGQNSSMNVATAAAIAVYELVGRLRNT